MKLYYDYDANTLYSRDALKEIFNRQVENNENDFNTFDQFLDALYCGAITEVDFYNDIPDHFENLFYEMESETIFTIPDILESYNDFNTGETFEEYFNNALSRNGSLRKIEAIDLR